MAFSASELTEAAGVRRYGADYLKALNPVPSHRGGWHTINEPFTGAWQRNLEEKHGTVLCYPTLYACLSRISQDIGTMPFVLKRKDQNRIWREVEGDSPYWPVLRKPNKFQTDQQFREAWVLSLLIHGNAYILKQRDNRGIVTDLYVMDPCRVMPMIADNGDVYYQVNYPSAQNLLPENYPAEQLTIPAFEIIHHRINCFIHQLVGIPPLCAANLPAVKNLKILRNSTEFFANGARPGGILTAPAGISKEDGDAIKEAWQQQYGNGNQGKIGLIGADLKYTDLGMSSGADSQLVAQLEYSDRQVCQPFHVPPFMAGIGEIPAGMEVDEVTTAYYQRALRPIVEGMERLLDEGLRISRPMGVELDENALLRMDLGKLAEVESALVGGKIKTPDEAREMFGLAPTGGGNTLWGQNQDYPLGMLANRAEWDPDMQATPPPVAPAAPPPSGGDGGGEDEEATRAFLAYVQRELEAGVAGDWVDELFSQSPLDYVRALAAASARAG